MAVFDCPFMSPRPRSSVPPLSEPLNEWSKLSCGRTRNFREPAEHVADKAPFGLHPRVVTGDLPELAALVAEVASIALDQSANDTASSGADRRTSPSARRAAGRMADKRADTCSHPGTDRDITVLLRHCCDAAGQHYRRQCDNQKPPHLAPH